MKLIRFTVLMVLFISALSVLGQSFLTNGLVAYYSFNGDALDQSGNHFDGITSSNCFYIADRFGNTNRAVYVTNTVDEETDDDSSRIDIPSDAINSLSAGTITVWIKPDTIVSGGILVKQHNGINTYAALSIGGTTDGFGGYNDQQPGIIYFHPQNGAPVVASSSVISTQAWQQIVVVFDTSSCAVYINGILSGANSGDFSIPDDLDPSILTSIGCWRGDEFSFTQPRYIGAIDDFRVYNRAFSSDEVFQFYQIESGIPFGSPTVDLGKAVYPKFSSLNVGYDYQLQISTNLINWDNFGTPFTATTTNMIYPTFFKVDDWNQLYFRLH